MKIVEKKKKLITGAHPGRENGKGRRKFEWVDCTEKTANKKKDPLEVKRRIEGIIVNK